MKSSVTAGPIVEGILSILLESIETPEGWNARSGNWHEDAADPASDDGGFEGLKESMRVAGRNDEPVLLRSMSNYTRPDDGGPRYVLVDGFRRVRAAKELGWTTIRAIVETMTEFEARRRNLSAQAGRIKHKTADLAWGLAELKKLGGPKLTNAELGTLVGVSTHYAGTLLRIMQEVEPRVTEAWRKASVKVDFTELQKLTVMPQHEHWKKWEELLLESQTRPAPRGKFTDALRLEGRARELGRTIGALHRLGVLAMGYRFREAMPLLTKRVLEDEQIDRLDKIMREGYDEGLSGKDTK